MTDFGHPHYTVTRIYAQTEKPYGAVHAADNDRNTRCGLSINRNWYILTNRIGDGTVTCRKCKPTPDLLAL